MIKRRPLSAIENVPSTQRCSKGSTNATSPLKKCDAAAEYNINHAWIDMLCALLALRYGRMAWGILDTCAREPRRRLSTRRIIRKRLTYSRTELARRIQQENRMRGHGTMKCQCGGGCLNEQCPCLDQFGFCSDGCQCTNCSNTTKHPGKQLKVIERMVRKHHRTKRLGFIRLDPPSVVRSSIT